MHLIFFHNQSVLAHLDGDGAFAADLVEGLSDERANLLVTVGRDYVLGRASLRKN